MRQQDQRNQAAPTASKAQKMMVSTVIVYLYFYNGQGLWMTYFLIHAAKLDIFLQTAHCKLYKFIAFACNIHCKLYTACKKKCKKYQKSPISTKKKDAERIRLYIPRKINWLFKHNSVCQLQKIVVRPNVQVVGIIHKTYDIILHLLDIRCYQLIT